MPRHEGDLLDLQACFEQARSTFVSEVMEVKVVDRAGLACAEERATDGIPVERKDQLATWLAEQDVPAVTEKRYPQIVADLVCGVLAVPDQRELLFVVD